MLQRNKYPNIPIHKIPIFIGDSQNPHYQWDIIALSKKVVYVLDNFPYYVPAHDVIVLLPSGRQELTKLMAEYLQSEILTWDRALSNPITP